MPDQHRIEPSPSGGFVACWRNRDIYQNGRIESSQRKKLHARSWLGVTRPEKSCTKTDPADLSTMKKEAANGG